MDGRKTALADFVGNVLVHVTVSREGTGAGTIASQPAGIDCGAHCCAAFPYGTHITRHSADGKGRSGGSRRDLYKDSRGCIYELGKGGVGEPNPWGININDL